MASREDTYSIYPTAPTSYTNWQQSIHVVGRHSNDTRIDKQCNQAKQDLPVTPPSSADGDWEGRREDAPTMYRDAHRSGGIAHNSEAIGHQRAPLVPLAGNTSPWRESPTRLTKDASPRSCSTHDPLLGSSLEQHLPH